MVRNFLLIIQAPATLHHDDKYIFLVVMQPYMLRECELMCKIVLSKENTQPLEQYAMCTSWGVMGVCHM